MVREEGVIYNEQTSVNDTEERFLCTGYGLGLCFVLSL